MPVDLGTFDASLKTKSLHKICGELGLEEPQCKRLEAMIPQICGVRRGTRKKRVGGKWQECIASRTKGKPFGSVSFKELAKEYRAGRCP